MIRNRKDLQKFLVQDRKALSIPNPTLSMKIKQKLFPNEIWKYERLLRYTEYYHNTLGNILHKVLYFLYKEKLHKQGVKLGFSIPLNVCDYGLSLPHYGSIVISENAKIGKYCHIHSCVNIGASAGRPEAPVIGDNVYIGPGAILFGDIKIGNNNTIAANATVNKSFEGEFIVIGGTPAIVLKQDYKSWLEFNQITL